MEENYCVYIHTFPNGKVYVGQGKQPIENRWKDGWGYCGQKRIYNAIRKYGWKNIKHEIAVTGLSQTLACKTEAKLIERYNSNAMRGENGYNMSDGGESGSCGYKHTDACKKRMSELNKGENNRFFGKTHTDDTRKKISAANKNKIISVETRTKMSISKLGSKHPQFNKPRSDETKKKISNANIGQRHPQYGMLGSLNPHSKSVMCIETGVVYGCLEDIRAEFHTDVSHVSSACRGNRKTACGYHWEYVEKTNK